MAKKKGHGGRPALPPEERKANFTIRMRPELRARMQEAATANDRSLGEEAETRLETSLKDDVIAGDLADVHDVIRRYFRSLGMRRTVEDFDLNDPAIVAALRMGLDLIIDAIGAGSISEERIKKFYLKDVDDLNERGGAVAVNIVNDAFSVLSAVGLGSVDPLKVGQWFREQAKRK